MNMNGTPSGYSQMGAQSSFSQMGSMMGMTPSMVDARSPHFVRGKAAVGRQTVTAPDLSKLGEDLALRALSADAELKRRLKAEQYDIGGHFIKVDGISPNGTIVVAIRLADNGSCAPWLDNAHEEGKRALEQPLQSKLHDMLARNDIQIQVPPLFTRFFVTTLLAPLTGDGRVSGTGGIRNPKVYSDMRQSPMGTPTAQSPIRTPSYGSRTPGGSTIRTPTHRGLLVRTPTGDSIIRTPTQSRDNFFKPPPLQMIATGIQRTASMKSTEPETPGGAYSPFGMPPPPTWAMNEPLTPQNKLPPLRVTAELKNDAYAGTQPPLSEGPPAVLSGGGGAGAGPTTPGGGMRGPRSTGSVVRTPGVKASDPRGQSGVVRNAIFRSGARGPLQNGAVPGARTDGVMPTFGSRSPKGQETAEEKVEREAALLFAAASGALKGTSGVLKSTSGALKGTSGVLKNSLSTRGRVAPGGGRLSTEGDNKLRAVKEDAEVDLAPGVPVAEASNRESIDDMHIELGQNIMAVPMPVVGDVADMTRIGLGVPMSLVPGHAPQNPPPVAVAAAPPAGPLNTPGLPSGPASSESGFYEPELQMDTQAQLSPRNMHDAHAPVPDAPKRRSSHASQDDVNQSAGVASYASYVSSGVVPHARVKEDSRTYSKRGSASSGIAMGGVPAAADSSWQRVSRANAADSGGYDMPPDMPPFQVGSTGGLEEPPDEPPFQTMARKQSMHRSHSNSAAVSIGAHSHASPRVASGVVQDSADSVPINSARSHGSHASRGSRITGGSYRGAEATGGHSAVSHASSQSKSSRRSNQLSNQLSNRSRSGGVATPGDGSRITYKEGSDGLALDLGSASMGGGDSVRSGEGHQAVSGGRSTKLRTISDVLREREAQQQHRSSHIGAAQDDSNSVALQHSARSGQRAQQSDSVGMDGSMRMARLSEGSGIAAPSGGVGAGEASDVSVGMMQGGQSASAAVTGDVKTVSAALRRLQASVQAAGAMHAPQVQEQQQPPAAGAPPRNELAELRAAMQRSAAAQHAALANEQQAAAEAAAEQQRRMLAEQRAAQAAAAAAEQERLEAQEAELRREEEAREAEERAARRLKQAQAAQVSERATADAQEAFAAARTHAAHVRRMSSQDSEAVSSDPRTATTATAENMGPFGTIPLEPLSGASAVCLVVVGTRGDVQPFLAVARELRRYGHRVRLATHAPYREFVQEHSVEFYPLPGGPSLYSEYIARKGGASRAGGNAGGAGDFDGDSAAPPGREGDGGPAEPAANLDEVTRDTMWSMFQACTEPDPEHALRPFTANAIIANPRAFGALCCAERLKIPLHLMSLMPSTPTTQFHHPMSVVQSINMGSALSGLPNDIISGAANYFSYQAFDLHLWQGLSPHIAAFRKDLQLPQYPDGMTAPAHALHNLRIPISYLWSPSFVPKPRDWGNHVQVCGDAPVDLQAEMYRPPRPLATFLEFPNPAPIFIGFGALAIPDPVALTELIYDAARASGKRIVLQRGFADLGKGVENKPDNVCLVGTCPHSWLFARCSAAVHHGGAGTTAAALRAGLPTLVVPVCGDQQFWGERCTQVGLGVRPVPLTRLRRQDLLGAFSAFEQPEMKEKAAAMREEIAREAGAENAVRHFHACLKQKGRVVRPGAISIDGLYSSHMPMKKLSKVPPGMPVYKACQQYEIEEQARREAAAAAEAERMNAKPQKSAPWYSCLMCGAGRN